MKKGQKKRVWAPKTKPKNAHKHLSVRIWEKPCGYAFSFFYFLITTITEEDSRDWKPDFTVEDILNSALKDVAPGSILLLHIGAKHTAEALPILLERLKADGYSFVTVSDLILKKNYTIDHAGEQHPA